MEWEKKCRFHATKNIPEEVDTKTIETLEQWFFRLLSELECINISQEIIKNNTINEIQKIFATKTSWKQQYQEAQNAKHSLLIDSFSKIIEHFIVSHNLHTIKLVWEYEGFKNYGEYLKTFLVPALSEYSYLHTMSQYFDMNLENETYTLMTMEADKIREVMWYKTYEPPHHILNWYKSSKYQGEDICPFLKFKNQKWMYEKMENIFNIWYQQLDTEKMWITFLNRSTKSEPRYQ